MHIFKINFNYFGFQIDLFHDFLKLYLTVTLFFIKNYHFHRKIPITAKMNVKAHNGHSRVPLKFRNEIFLEKNCRKYAGSEPDMNIF